MANDGAPQLLDQSSEAFELRIFDPKRVRLFRVAGVTRLTWEGERSWTKASPARAFPLSDPCRYIGFIDGAGKDIGVVRDPSQMDAESRRVLDEELEKRYFVPVVERVLAIKEEFGTIYWTVETDRGTKEIVVRNMRDNLQELSPTRVIITDVEGNRFEFPDISSLDAQSLGAFMRRM